MNENLKMINHILHLLNSQWLGYQIIMLDSKMILNRHIREGSFCEVVDFTNIISVTQILIFHTDSPSGSYNRTGAEIKK